MVFHSWLAGLCQKLALRRRQGSSRRVSSRSKQLHSATAEVLEARQLLFAGPIGGETLVNTQTAGNQTTPVVATDSAGNYVVAWDSYGQDGSMGGIYAQRYSAAGVAQGAEFRVNTFTTADQSAPSIAMDSNGNFVIAWQSGPQDGSGLGIFAQRFAANGTTLGTEFQVNTYTTESQELPSVAMDANGDFVIAWDSSNQYSNAIEIYARRYSSSGVAQGGELKVNSHTTWSERTPSVSMDAQGDFVVAWQAINGYDPFDPVAHIHARRFNQLGTPLGVEITVSTFAAHSQMNPSIAVDASGDFVVAWQSYQDGFGYGVYAQRYNSAGTAQGGETQVNTHTDNSQFNPRVAIDPSGNFTVIWQSKSQDGDSYGVYAQQFNADGTRPSTEQRINTTTTGGQANPAVAMDSAGDFVAVWQSNGQDGSVYGIYQQRFQKQFAPVLSGIESTALMVTGSSAVPVTSTLLVADQDSNNLTGATIQITGNYQSAEDLLAFTNTANITSSWNAATGTLTLSGTDTVSNYRAALRNVTFKDTSASPNTSLTRTVTFQTTDGSQQSNTASRDLTVRAAANAPVISGVNGTTTFNKGSSPVSIAPGLVITSLNLTSATVTFTNWQGEDRVDFSNSFAFQHTFTQDLAAQTATLTISGTGTAAQYQQTLRSIIYWDVRSTPTTSIVRTAKFSVTDVNANSGSGTQSIQVSTASAPDLPPAVMVNDTTSLSYVAPGPGIAIFGNALVSDPDSNNLSKLTVQITSGYQHDSNGTDFLTAGNTNSLGILSTFDPATGTLTLQGVSYVGNYRQALRMVLFLADGSAVSSATRTFTVIATDDFFAGPVSSTPVTRNLTVSSNAAPVVAGIETTVLNALGDTQTPIAPTVTVSDADDANLVGATIIFRAGYVYGQDQLSFTDTTHITGHWDPLTATLTLSGTDTVANYQAALRSITFGNTSQTPDTGVTRTISLTVNDPLQQSNAVIRNVTVQATATSPTVTGVTAISTQFTQNSPPVSIAPNLMVTGQTIASATVTIAGWQAEDRLAFYNSFAFQHTFQQDLVNHTATLTLTGADTAAHYQQVLRSVTYSDVAGKPITMFLRPATFTVVDTNHLGALAHQSISVLAVNNPPVVMVNDSSSLSYQKNSAPIAIMNNALVTDPDSDNLSKMTIQITGGYQNDANGHDILSFANQLGISGSFDAATGTLTLTGSSYVGNYRVALRAVMFNTTGSSISLATRTFTVIGYDNNSPTPAASAPVSRNLTVTS